MCGSSLRIPEEMVISSPATTCKLHRSSCRYPPLVFCTAFQFQIISSIYLSCVFHHRHCCLGHSSGTSQSILRNRELPPKDRVAPERSFRSEGTSTASILVIYDACCACFVVQASVDSRKALLFLLVATTNFRFLIQCTFSSRPI